ncbi:MAG: ABC transporter ATP-binding protein [Planctomycetota bacterium]|jgi:ABC-2 type transport system ATP-binding protein|nr:ABC transporter ATP-binding protein [Planctomycetota bacterium]
MPPLIQTHALTKHFKHPLFVWQIRARALTDLNLSVERGEIFGLLGPNGSGKSTTIKLLLGMLYPTAGEISLFGRRPDDLYVKQRLSYLPEETNLYRFLTAEETLDFYGRLFRLPRRERRHRVEQLLDLTGLRQNRSRPLGEFSKGMQRRVGLAQALINDPELVILDEPTSGLDPLGIREVKNIILELKAKGKTVLLSSHLLDDVEDVCDRVAILYGGKVRASGTVNELLSDQKRTTISGEFPQPVIEQMRRLIAENHLSADIAPARERLESLFMKVVRDAEKLKTATSGARNDSADLTFLTAAATAAPEITATVKANVVLQNLTTVAAPVTPPPLPPVIPPIAAEAAKPAAAKPVVQEIHAAVDDDLLARLTKTN